LDGYYVALVACGNIRDYYDGDDKHTDNGMYNMMAHNIHNDNGNNKALKDTLYIQQHYLLRKRKQTTSLKATIT
jgi:hypothetical protein